MSGAGTFAHPALFPSLQILSSLCVPNNLPNSTNVTKRCSGVVTEADILYINRNATAEPTLDWHDRALCPLRNKADSKSHMMGSCEGSPILDIAVAQFIAARPQGYSAIFVYTGKLANLPEFALNIGTERELVTCNEHHL
jgi:hypothetical protein